MPTFSVAATDAQGKSQEIMIAATTKEEALQKASLIRTKDGLLSPMSARLIDTPQKPSATIKQIKVLRLLGITFILIGVSFAIVAFYTLQVSYGIPNHLFKEGNQYFGYRPGFLNIFWPCIIWITLAVIGILFIIRANEATQEHKKYNDGIK